MTDYPQNTPKQDSVPLNPIYPQVAQAPPIPTYQIPLGPEPCTVTCPSCGASIVTTLKVQPNSHTHLMALLLCLVCVCCVCVPYCVNSCQSVQHYCPSCDAYLGTHQR